MIEYDSYGNPTLSSDEINETVQFFKKLLGRNPSAVFFGNVMALVDKEAKNNRELKKYREQQERKKPAD